MKSRALLYSMVAALAGLIILELWMRNSNNDEIDKEELAYATSDDVELQAAFDQARSTLNYFFKTANNPPQDTQGFSVKIALSDENATEYFWVYPFSPEAEGFSGKIVAEPKLISNTFKGEIVQFRQEQIVDWTFEDKATEKMHGNFTACVELARVAPENFEQFQKLYGLDCRK
ncbi:DUF2314 domain-containing protein [Aurantivibrio infirmus]